MCKNCGPDPAEQVIDHSIDHPFTPLAQAIENGAPDICTVCLGHISAHPDKYHYLMQVQAQRIAKYGHEVRVVFPNDGDSKQRFAYTIGRTAYDQPELLITGPLAPEHFGQVLNAVGEISDLRSGQILDAENIDHSLGPWPAKLVEVTDLEAAEMFGVTSLFPTTARALQVLWPDTQGRFPDEEGYDLSADTQPIYV